MTNYIDLKCPRCKIVKALGNPNHLHKCNQCGHLLEPDYKPITDFDKLVIQEGCL